MSPWHWVKNSSNIHYMEKYWDTTFFRREKCNFQTVATKKFMYLKIVFPPQLQQFWSVWNDCTHFNIQVVFPAWHFCLPHLWVSCRVSTWCHRSLTFCPLSSTSPGGGGAVACGDVSQPPPAAALTGVPSPNSCPSSVATTSSLPPSPAPWWLSSGLSQLSQQLGEAGMRTFPRSPCILLLWDGWSRSIPRLCTPPPDQSYWAAWTCAPLVFPLPWHSQLNNEGLLGRLYHMYKSLVFGDEFLAQGLHLKSHQRCSAGIRTWLSAD